MNYANYTTDITIRVTGEINQEVNVTLLAVISSNTCFRDEIIIIMLICNQVLIRGDSNAPQRLFCVCVYLLMVMK